MIVLKHRNSSQYGRKLYQRDHIIDVYHPHIYSATLCDHHEVLPIAASRPAQQSRHRLSDCVQQIPHSSQPDGHQPGTGRHLVRLVVRPDVCSLQRRVPMVRQPGR